MGRFKMPTKHKLTPVKQNLIGQLIEMYEPKSISDLHNALKDLMGDTIQGMLEAELDETFGLNNSQYNRHKKINLKKTYSVITEYIKVKKRS